MSGLAHLYVYKRTGDNEGVADIIESTQIPRVGEVIYMASGDWTVVRVRYIWPEDKRAPLVDLLVEPGPSNFWTGE